MNITFTEATALARKISISQDVQLLLYGLYKQATVGDCNIPPPKSPIDAVKYQSWAIHVGKSKEQAENEYVGVLTSSQSQSGWGNKVSKFQLLDEDVEEPRDENQEKVHKFCKSVRTGELDLVLLEEIGINVKDQEGLTALHHACDEENEEMVELLLNLGADVNAQDSQGMTPLHYAAELNNPQIFQVLIKTQSPDVFLKDNDGNTVRDIVQTECASFLP